MDRPADIRDENNIPLPLSQSALLDILKIDDFLFEFILSSHNFLYRRYSSAVFTDAGEVR